MDAKQGSKDAIIEALSEVKQISSIRAAYLYDHLGVRSLADIIEVGERGELTQLRGVGESTARSILASARALASGERIKEETRSIDAGEEPAEEPTPAVEEPEPEAEERAPRAEGGGLLETIVCPNCGNDAFEIAVREVTCTACRSEYPFEKGALDLVPPYRRADSLAERALDSGAIVSAYERFVRPRLPGAGLEEERARSALGLLDLERGARVLDAGCGDGEGTAAIAERVRAGGDAGLVVGVDVSMPLIQRAVAEHAQGGVGPHFARADLTRLPFRRSSFSRVYCAGALAITQDLDEALRNFSYILEPGGILVVSTLARGRGLVKRVAARALRSVLGVRAVERQALAERLERADFEIREEHYEGNTLTIKARRAP